MGFRISATLLILPSICLASPETRGLPEAPSAPKKSF